MSWRSFAQGMSRRLMHDQMLLLGRKVQYAAGYMQIYMGVFSWYRAK